MKIYLCLLFVRNFADLSKVDIDADLTHVTIVLHLPKSVQVVRREAVLLSTSHYHILSF